MTHTPGPWGLFNHVHPVRGDACLIAAAPDMLEVLKETEQVLEHLRYELVSYGVCAEVEALTEHTKKVIARAEGR